MLVPNTNTRARCTGDDESAPKTRDSTRRRCTASSKRHVDRRACSRRHPWGDGPRPQDWRGGVRVRGAPFMSAQSSRILVQVVAHRRIAAPAMEARPCRASIPQRGSIEPAPSPAFRPSRRWRPCLGAPRLLFVWFAGRRNPRLAVVPVRVLAAAAAVPIVARRLVSRPARARALARLARLAARGPAPRSRTAPIRERHRGAAAAHTVAVVAPAAAHLLTYGKRQGRETARNSLGGASRTPVAEGGGALWKARRSISPREENGEKTQCGQQESAPLDKRCRSQ